MSTADNLLIRAATLGDLCLVWLTSRVRSSGHEQPLERVELARAVSAVRLEMLELSSCFLMWVSNA